MKTILITGGSRGIGRATVEEFLNKGWKVITTSTTGKLTYEHRNLTVHQLDLGSSVSIEKLINNLRSRDMKIDVLVNNGWQAKRSQKEDGFKNLEEMLTVNLVGTVKFTLGITPLINEKGIIVNISSEFGSLAEDWGYRAPSYRIAKAGINMFTRNYYANPQIKARNIKVYSFDPGWVRTDMGGPDAEREPEEPAKEIFQLVNSNKPSGQFYRGLVKRDW